MLLHVKVHSGRCIALYFVIICFIYCAKSNTCTVLSCTNVLHAPSGAAYALYLSFMFAQMFCMRIYFVCTIILHAHMFAGTCILFAMMFCFANVLPVHV